VPLKLDRAKCGIFAASRAIGAASRNCDTIRADHAVGSNSKTKHATDRSRFRSLSAGVFWIEQPPGDDRFEASDNNNNQEHDRDVNG
jgi:hypothetical protein